MFTDWRAIAVLIVGFILAVLQALVNVLPPEWVPWVAAAIAVATAIAHWLDGNAVATRAREDKTYRAPMLIEP
jgi:phosphatidylglycerophosphate synthase